MVAPFANPFAARLVVYDVGKQKRSRGW